MDGGQDLVAGLPPLGAWDVPQVPGRSQVSRAASSFPKALLLSESKSSAVCRDQALCNCRQNPPRSWVYHQAGPVLTLQGGRYDGEELKYHGTAC